MDHKNTNRAIMTFVILSVIVHGLIAYVIVKTNDNEQNIESIEIIGQDEIDQQTEYKEPPAPKKRIARKKQRVETPRVEKPRVETPRVETPRVESGALSQKNAAPQKDSSDTDLSDTNSSGTDEEGVLSGLPEAPLDTDSSGTGSPGTDSSGTESSDKGPDVAVSDEDSKIVVDDNAEAVASEVERSSGEEGSVASGNKSGSAAIQELKKVTDIAEQSEAQAGNNSNVVSEQSSNTDSSGADSSGADSSGADSSGAASANAGNVASVQKQQTSKPAVGLKNKKDSPTYRVNQMHVIRPTSFKYPEASRRLKEEGTGILRMFFDKNGQPRKIEVLKSTGSRRLDDAARQGASTLRLKSLGYAFIYELPVRFQLDFTDQQLNESFDLLAPDNSREDLGKFKSKAQSQ